MFWFALASLGPVITLAAACLIGGPWPLLALGHVTIVVLVMDSLGSPPQPVRKESSTLARALTLNLTLGIVHFPLLALGVWSLAESASSGSLQKLALVLALGLYLGQVSNSNAHELIHESKRWPRRLGKAIYISLLFGHHASAHPKVHHIHVASDADPNSARLGEGFYRFWPRAWLGSFRAGWYAETTARSRADRAPAAPSHPYFAYCGGAFATLVAAFGLAGWSGVWALFGIAAYAQMQLLLADYVQHYGLRRVIGIDGKLEAAGPQHAWNAPHWYSSAMMLNAPRHSDHHAHPARRFPALRLDPGTMPVWPYSMPVMATLALFPTLWRRIMDKRALEWRQRSSSASENIGCVE